MNSQSLCNLAGCDSILRSKFGGVYASDELPRTFIGYSCFTVNLDSRAKPGSHWVALAFRNNTCFYFCSFASVPKKGKILNFIKQNSQKLMWNKCRYQSATSFTCGQFCLHFLYKFVRKQTLSPLDSNNIAFNEKFIQRFVAKNFRLQKCCLTPHSNQICHTYKYRHKRA
ncbi:uncharacterized protein TNCT_185791 [Trichonephila clavata]|uniref:Ubiquitin-like protease family profile domain-containing protein n=1 Tax=Trichonephila clavata TaxID=2740835 RepID=A0A8X6LHU8_TRICU|nr:uncharacterized protein TNCT_185791 [Trichonephila clavata]